MCKDLALQLRSRLEHLNQGGFRVLKDTCTLLKPLADLTISAEGEHYVTASTVIPRLLAAKKHADEIFQATNNGDDYNGSITDPLVVSQWNGAWKKLWDTYLHGFITDELFLCATLLDPRNGCGRNLTPPILLKAKAALLERLQKQFEKLQNVADEHRGVIDVPLTNPVIDQGDDALSADYVASIFGSQTSSTESPNKNFCTYNTAEEELKTLFDEVNRTNAFKKWYTNPIDMYKKSSRLQLCSVIAPDILCVPAGEAPSERIFSIASRVIKADRSSMRAQLVAKATFIKKNKLSLAPK